MLRLFVYGLDNIDVTRFTLYPFFLLLSLLTFALEYDLSQHVNLPHRSHDFLRGGADRVRNINVSNHSK